MIEWSMASNRNLPSLVLVLALSLFGLAGGKKPRMLVSFHIEAERQEAEVDSQGKFIIPLTLGNPPTTFFFHKIPELTNKQVAGFYAFPSSSGNGYGVAFKLNAQGRDRLQSITTQNSGKRLLTTVSTRPVNFVVIDRAISHGYIVVWSGLTAADIDLFRESMTEIVPKAGGPETGAASARGAELEDAVEDRGPRRRGPLGRLFGGRHRDAAETGGGASGSADDFAPSPN